MANSPNNAADYFTPLHKLHDPMIKANRIMQKILLSGVFVFSLCISHAAIADESRNWLGIELETLSGPLREAAGIPGGLGVVVAAVFPDSPAAHAGLKERDIIVLCKATPVTGPADVTSATEESSPGSVIELNIIRDQNELVLSPAVQVRPPVKTLQAALASLAEAGNRYACNRLGQELVESKKKADKTRGVKLLENATKQEHPEAMVRFARLLIHGLHVTSDPERGHELLHKAAERETASAYRELGKCYLYGFGVERNATKASAMLQKSIKLSQGQADKLVAEAFRDLGTAYYLGEGTNRDLIAAATNLRIAADMDDPVAQYLLARQYRDGHGVNIDPHEAVKLYQASAEQGVSDAMKELGDLLRKGKGIKPEPVAAVAWYRKGAEANDPGCIEKLAYCYAEGVGVKKDDSTAASYFRKAAESGHVAAMYNYAMFLRDGRGVAKDLVSARSWFEKSAAAGQRHAHLRLAVMSFRGDGGPQNREKGIEHCLRAKDAGLAEEADKLLRAVGAQ